MKEINYNAPGVACRYSELHTYNWLRRGVWMGKALESIETLDYVPRIFLRRLVLVFAKNQKRVVFVSG